MALPVREQPYVPHECQILGVWTARHPTLFPAVTMIRTHEDLHYKCHLEGTIEEFEVLPDGTRIIKKMRLENVVFDVEPIDEEQESLADLLLP